MIVETESKYFKCDWNDVLKKIKQYWAFIWAKLK